MSVTNEFVETKKAELFRTLGKEAFYSRVPSEVESYIRKLEERIKYLEKINSWDWDSIKKDYINAGMQAGIPVEKLVIDWQAEKQKIIYDRLMKGE